MENEVMNAGLDPPTTGGPGLEPPPGGAPAGRTIEGIIYGDQSWPRRANWWYKWMDSTTMHRIINGYLRDNWQVVRADLAFEAEHVNVFDAGQQVGEGYYNSEALSDRSPVAVHHTTSRVRIVVQMAPGTDPPQMFVYTAYPIGL